MKHINYRDMAADDVDIDGAKYVNIRWLVSDKDGAPNFALRMFEVGVGGFTPYHQHDWEHEIFIFEFLYR